MSQRSHRRTQRQSLSQPSTSTAHFEVEDEDNIPASQISPNKALTNQEHTHHVSNVVKYILGHDHTKVPITKSAISKAVGCHNKNFKPIMESSKLILKDVFGYNLIEIDGKIIVTNKIKNNLLEFDEQTSTRYVLLFLVLAHIFMSGEQCSQGSIVNFLQRLGIVEDGNMKSDVFGDVLELLTGDFVKEKYIQIEKIEKEGDEPEFKWGMRAENELQRRTVMEFVSMVYHNKEINHWTQQYERMLQVERRQHNAGHNTTHH